MLITWSFYILCYLTFFYWLTLIIGWHKTLYIKLKHSLSFGLKASFSVVRCAQFFLGSPCLSSHFPSYPSTDQVSQCISLPMRTCLSRSILLSQPIHILKHQTLWVTHALLVLYLYFRGQWKWLRFLIQLLTHVKSFEEISTKDFKTIQMVKKDCSD